MLFHPSHTLLCVVDYHLTENRTEALQCVTDVAVDFSLLSKN